MSLIGIVAIVAFCWLISSDRRRVNWHCVLWGLGLQFLFGILILKTYPDEIFAGAQIFFTGINHFAEKGSRFLFGSLVENKDFVILSMGSVIIFVSALLGVLNYLRVLPALIYVLARMMQRTMRTSGAETLSAAMQVLLGIEAVTGIRKAIGKMTRSELFSVMTCFMGTIAGSVMAVYVTVFGASPGHILAASIMSAPACLALAKLVVPETGEPETGGKVQWAMLLPDEKGVIEAAANGAVLGLQLTATIAAILLAFVAIIHMIDGLLGLLGTSFAGITGYLFAPVAFVLGVPWEDCLKAGNLLGVKTVFNEWLAYSEMQAMVKAGELAPRTVMVLTYAMCTFANFGSLAILIGGISALAPERREEVIGMGLRSLLTGLLAGFMTAAIAGTLIDLT
jgi:CNT family concentrative nucleoside transporter